MSLSEEQKRLKREEYANRWTEAVASFEDEGLPLDELTDFRINLEAEMAEDGLYNPRTFDPRLLLDSILEIRSALDDLLSSESILMSSGSDDSSRILSKERFEFLRDLYDIPAKEILYFLSEVERIVSVQPRSGFGHDANDIKQELYSLLVSQQGTYSQEYRREERIQIMVRLVALHVPDEDWSARKKWAQASFVARNIWSIKKQGAEWKELKAYWLDWGDIWDDPVIGWDSKEVEIDDLWNALTVEKRGDRRRNS